MSKDFPYVAFVIGIMSVIGLILIWAATRTEKRIDSDTKEYKVYSVITAPPRHYHDRGYVISKYESCTEELWLEKYPNENGPHIKGPQSGGAK